MPSRQITAHVTPAVHEEFRLYAAQMGLKDSEVTRVTSARFPPPDPPTLMNPKLTPAKPRLFVLVSEYVFRTVSSLNFTLTQKLARSFT